eukprot:761224-Hanusia_phi.AAC.2
MSTCTGCSPSWSSLGYVVAPPKSFAVTMQSDGGLEVIFQLCTVEGRDRNETRGDVERGEEEREDMCKIVFINVNLVASEAEQKSQLDQKISSSHGYESWSFRKAWKNGAGGKVLAVNPKDVDALCGYACFLSTVVSTDGLAITHYLQVRDDFAGAAELYSTAVKTDPSRARRITVQLWADLWAMRMENERSMRVKGQWMEYFRKMDTNGEGKLDKKIVQDVLKQTELVISPEDLDAVLQDNKVVYEELAESLSKAPPPNVFSKVQMKLKQGFKQRRMRCC